MMLLERSVNEVLISKSIKRSQWFTLAHFLGPQYLREEILGENRLFSFKEMWEILVKYSYKSILLIYWKQILKVPWTLMKQNRVNIGVVPWHIFWKSFVLFQLSFNQTKMIIVKQNKNYIKHNKILNVCDSFSFIQKLKIFKWRKKN